MELGKLPQDVVIAIGTMPAFFSCYFRNLIPGLGTVLLLFISRVDPWPHRGHDVQLQIEAVKQSILVRLGLEMPPTIRGPVDQEEIQRAQLHYQELLAQLQANRTKLPPSTTLHHLRPECKCSSFSEGLPWIERGGMSRMPFPSSWASSELPQLLLQCRGFLEQIDQVLESSS